MSVRIHVPGEEIAAFCRRHRIRRLAFFGSVLRDDFTPESDVDVLVEFEPGTRVGLRFFALEQELSELLGCKVDLNTPGFLSKYFRDSVMAEALQAGITRRHSTYGELLVPFSIVKWFPFQLSKCKQRDQSGSLFDCQMVPF
jgi:predicted nucleotidyltransferase